MFVDDWRKETLSSKSEEESNNLLNLALVNIAFHSIQRLEIRVVHERQEILSHRRRALMASISLLMGIGGQIRPNYLTNFPFLLACVLLWLYSSPCVRCPSASDAD